MRFVLGVLFLWQMVALQPAAGGLYDIFKPCCLEGVKWSGASYRCDNYPAPVANISDTDQAACLSVIEVCCIKQTQILTCEDGKQTALAGDVCAIRDMDPGAEQFRECCHCCRLGLEARRGPSGQCGTPNLGEPCDSKYRECCRGEQTRNVSFSDGLSSTDDHVIDHSDTPVARQSGDQLTSAQSGLTIETERDQGVGSGYPIGPSDDPNYSGTGTGEEDDIDECSLFAGMICSHQCVNTEDGFYCTCPDGMVLDHLDNTTCKLGPAMEGRSCELNNPCEQKCLDLEEGGIECRCYAGFRLASDLISCEDIDECQEGLIQCAPSQRCVNTRGRYTCMSSRCPPGYDLNSLTGQCEPGAPSDCQPGFAFNSVTGRCEDLNECGLGIDHCGTGERCENTIGSYACRRVRHCGTGYTLDEESQQCQDNDECLMGTHDCDKVGYDCQNTRGSFRCVPKSCPTGYKFDTSEGRCVVVECPAGLRPNEAGKCEDINECEEYGPTTCKRHQQCVNTRGSYYCRNFVNCPHGYEPTDNSGCQDINECETGDHKCGEEQQCVNRQGSYFCQCPRGLRHDDNGRCVDVDECAYGASICPSNSRCVNTIGSFNCECVDGLVSDGNDSCTDVNECEQENVCQQNCVNVLGTFFCSCNRGYQLRDDKKSCEDIDECTQFGGGPGRSGVCGGRCINLPGSFRCDCPRGWRLKPDGRSCEDINECAEGTAYCPHSESVCINTRGGHKCPVVRCPEGFIRTNSTRQPNSFRCKRVSVNCPECRRGLRSRTYNFLSFASNVLVPAPLFSMTGSRLRRKHYGWDLDLITARPLRTGIARASSEDFRLEKSREFARVTLLNRIDGPQDVILKLTMNVTSYHRGYEGMAESRIYLYITEEDQNL